MTFPLHTIRSTAAELLAYAVCKLFPDAQLVAGQADELGFSYDFLIEQPIDDHFIPLIEQAIRTLIKEDHSIKILDMMRENAQQLFEHHDQPIKAEIIGAYPDNVLQIFQMGDFFDFNPTNFLENTSDVGVIKIYDIVKTTLYLDLIGELDVVRIQGTALPNQQLLKQFLKQRESAKKRDHRLLGKEMDLFTLTPENDCIWHPKGNLIKNLLVGLLQTESPTQEFPTVSSPKIIDPILLKKSGFLASTEQKELLFPAFNLDGIDYVLSPTPSFFHASLFKANPVSYRQLPIRYNEITEVHTNFKHSQLCGLLRTRTNTSDLSNIFCTPKQATEEIISSLQFINKTVTLLGLELQWHLTARGRKYAGTVEQWTQGLAWMTQALDSLDIKYAKSDEISFNGPRIDLKIVDASGRLWTASHIGLDFNLPDKLKLCYSGANGEIMTPLLLTRSLFGSIDRFIAVLLEHYAGLLPMWLTPEQLRIISVGEQNREYTNKVLHQVEQAGFRAYLEHRDEALGAKIHSAVSARVPYMIIIGQKEAAAQTVTVRTCDKEKMLSQVNLEGFLQELREKSAAETIHRSK